MDFHRSGKLCAVLYTYSRLQLYRSTRRLTFQEKALGSDNGGAAAFSVQALEESMCEACGGRSACTLSDGLKAVMAKAGGWWWCPQWGSGTSPSWSRREA